MSSELKVLQIVLVLFLTLISSTYNSNGKLFLLSTNITKHSYGQAFNDESFQYKNSSFNINFFFAIVPQYNQQGAHGMASSDQYLGMFNETNNGETSNNVIAIELDIHRDKEFKDIDGSHVAININGLRSLVSAPAGYYDNKDGEIHNLSLITGKVMRLLIVYSQPDKQLNVTISPTEFSVPLLEPILSLNRDLSLYLSEEMYFGFTASTGSIGALNYMLNLSSAPEVEHRTLDLSLIPTLPPYPKMVDVRTRTVLAVSLTLALLAAFIATWIKVLEKWKIQYRPHRLACKELLNTTKEKQLPGRGGFGQVYKGTLPSSDAQILVRLC